MSRRRRHARVPSEPFELTIDAMSHEGRGIGHLEGKTIFVEGALPGEQVIARYVAKHNKFDEAVVETVNHSAKERIESECDFARVCGGCSLHHFEHRAQIEFKQKILAEQLAHFGGLAPEKWLPPLQFSPLHYRRKARLGVKFVHKKDKVLVGFREKRSSFLTDIDRCRVLHPAIGELIEPLKTMIYSLHSRDSIPQLEVAIGGDDRMAIIVRHLKPLIESDQKNWLEFAQQYDFDLYYQPKGPKTVHKVWPEGNVERLNYRIEEAGVDLAFHPTDFTQVNMDINNAMVPLALKLLAVEKNERVLDLFCGLGNFTLALAKQASYVIGVEGSENMVERGYENAKRNQIDNVEFHCADLTQAFADKAWAQGGFDKLLIDPPRSGALEVIPHLPQLGAKRLVYVSCNPATLARDAGELKQLGFTLKKAGVMDMFPHTAHVESIALFEKNE